MKKLSFGWNFCLSQLNLIFVLQKRKWNGLLPIVFIGFLMPIAALAQQIKLEQGQNGGVGRPVVSPVSWATGNSNSGNSHYVEGQSVPYRMTISNVSAGSHSIIIEWDFRRDGKTAIDYVSSYQRIAETVDPLRGLTGNYGQPAFFSIPVPQRNALVEGRDGSQLQPLSSFNQLSDNQRQIVIYNAAPGTISYLPEGEPTAANSSTRLKMDFNVSGPGTKNIVLAWGGHIASRLDWGAPNAASDINGSPYHMRIVSFDGKAGNQD